jgi:Zn-finger nucleic acid-binding protein
MNCPHCDNALLALEHEGVELDYCPACQGTWLDAEELKLLLGGRAACDWLRTVAGEGLKEKTRRCPICRRKMRKSCLDMEPVVVVDECVRLDGIWLDHGELETLLAASPVSPQTDQLRHWLREIFVQSPAVQLS